MSNLVARLITGAFIAPIALWSVVSVSNFSVILWPTVLIVGLIEFLRNFNISTKLLPKGKTYLILGVGALYIILSSITFMQLLVLNGALTIILVAMANDIGGYVAGRAFGGPKLAPTISPGKTWAGFWGSVVFVLMLPLLSYAFSYPFNIFCLLSGAMKPLQSLPYMSAAANLIVYGLFATGGDLLQSWWKRYLGVKDSGAIFPGHGGLLDRLDSVLGVCFLIFITSLLHNFLG